ncbi:MAG: kynureninase, partial [Actinobacteria bacterium]|nr:kynureninase [Actinomycetota bacterium]
MTDQVTLDAAALDAADPLAHLRAEFELPEGIYLVGNSLGALPRAARDNVTAEFDRWSALGVEGHFTGDLAWEAYHELLTAPLSSLVGGGEHEVVAMNSLTVNLHLLMVSFYRPTPTRHKVLIEGHAFPSDHFAVESQIRQRGLDPATSLVVLDPRPGEVTLRPDDILAAIAEHGDSLALILLPGVQYYTGQVLPMAEITRAGHEVGATVGFDLAHAVGNVELDLHHWGVDFAAWCTYKYLNGGPGGVGAAFVHERHIDDQSLPKLLGWWGTAKATRFQMDTTFEAIPTVESWQLSNAPVLSMAALRASLA